MELDLAVQILESTIKDYARIMSAHARRYYGLLNFNVQVNFNYNKDRSIGGVVGSTPFIEISTLQFLKAITDETPLSFFEYKRFSADPVIGTLHDVHWTKALAATVAHEISHAIQYSNAKRVSTVLFHSNSHFIDRKAAGHRDLWRAIYRDLRISFVNDMK